VIQWILMQPPGPVNATSRACHEFTSEEPDDLAGNLLACSAGCKQFLPSTINKSSSALADINHFHHFEQCTVSRLGWAYMLKIKWSRGRLVGEPCGGFKNWRCASGLYCERRRGTIGICVERKT